jgi:DNA-binding transcriptional ArsR family regulator
MVAVTALFDLIPYFWKYGIMTLSPNRLDNTLLALRALGHASRLAAYRTLVQAGPEGLAVGALRAQLGLPPATLSAHLNILRAAGLVLDAREGRVIRVRADYPRMNALIAYLTENCCMGAGCADLPFGPDPVCVPVAGSRAKTHRAKGAS